MCILDKPGQGLIEHCLDLIASPVHPLPPFLASFSILLWSTSVPWPHVLLHGWKIDHELQRQSTGAGAKCNNNFYNVQEASCRIVDITILDKPGQALKEHGLCLVVSWSPTIHSLPPFLASFNILLWNTSVPWPHVLLHGRLIDHELQRQSTGAWAKCNDNFYNAACGYY